ncbi:hypothetical protein [Fibrobacter sp.]|uniref:hypothetical protein n=1 Tax=Fibrobacter sp. TaxID=35828 RepID=UPI0025BFEBDE|nr:hypothetical protein [Fibrobacter sp.]MBR3071288.1 hypothetical protein [Fibrobacter sp.]
MNKLLIIVAFGAVVSLTACSDDSSSNAGGSTQLDGKTVVSCDRVMTVAGMEQHSCHAIAADDAAVESFKAKCAPLSDLDKYTYTIGAGCPSAKLACDVQNQVEYFYDEASSHFSCTEIRPHPFYSANAGGPTQLDGKTVVSCDKVMTIMDQKQHSCHAIAADDAAVESFKAKCAPISDLDKTVYKIGSGCASAKRACDVDNQVEYFYDDASSKFSCAQIGPHAL